MEAPLIGIERHRIATDGKGVTTLVAFHGCPLQCRYCLNPQCLDKNIEHRIITPQELLDEIAVDNLYYLATGGGVTFGGGEPLLRSTFIREFCDIAPKKWNIRLETALNVKTKHLKEIMPYINHWYVDVKDMNDYIYHKYTGKNNQLLIKNLELLAAQVPQERITIRLPLIPNYNDTVKREASMAILKDMGFENFNLFNYEIHEHEGKIGQQFEATMGLIDNGIL